MKTEYETLVEAAMAVKAIRRELDKIEGSYRSPAWDMLYDAEKHITRWADELLRGKAA